MATLLEKSNFAAGMAGKTQTLAKELERREEKTQVLDKLVGQGLDASRDELREAMTFSVKKRNGKGEVHSMDERGQRKSIETEDARTRYESLSPEDHVKVMRALEKIVRIKDAMIAAKDKDDKNLFTTKDIIDELFTPLIREGLLPETLVVDGYSEVAVMLREVMASFKGMLKEQEEEKRKKEASDISNSHGAGGKMDRIKALAGRASSFVDGQVDVVAGKVGMTPEELKRAKALASKSFATAKAFKEAVSAGGELDDAIHHVPGKPETDKHGNEKTITKDVLHVLKSGVGGGTDLASAISDKSGAESDRALAISRGELRSGALALSDAIEQVLHTSLMLRSMPAADAVAGAFADAFDVKALVELVEPSLKSSPATPPEATAVVDLVGQAMAKAVGVAHGSLKSFGAELQKEFAGAAGGEISRLGGLLRSGSLPNPAGAFDGLAKPAQAAAQKVFGSQGFIQALGGNDVQQGMATVAREQNAGQEQELEDANTEIEDFERQLVLIDEGGMEMGRQQSLDVLIAQMKSDQQDLEIVLKVGALLGGAASSVVKLGTDASNVAGGLSIADQALDTVTKTVATEVAGSLMPALQAAQLVMKMTVTIIKIAARAELANKFRKDVEKARKAGSMLMPSIENFYSAKVTQQIYASIELALQAVQLAGAICSSVPEGITMAVGKALTTAAKAAEAGRDLAKTTQDEVMLRKGWNKTLDALNNPANRRAGLDALRHNATLAVHSIAWAAMNGDSMAQEILRSCGANAQSLADDGTDKDKVVEYLETLLNEDLKFKDARKIKLDWAPDPLNLSYVGWFTVKKRALSASPPAADEATKEIDDALKALDLQPKMQNLLAHLDAYTPEVLDGYAAQAKRVRDLFAEQRPYAADRTRHADMRVVCEKLQAMADACAVQLAELAAERRQQVQQQQPVQQPPQQPQQQLQPEAVAN